MTYYYQRDDKSWVQTSRASYLNVRAAGYNVAKARTPRFAFLQQEDEVWKIVRFKAKNGELQGATVAVLSTPSGEQPAKEVVEAIMAMKRLTWFSLEEHGTHSDDWKPIKLFSGPPASIEPGAIDYFTGPFTGVCLVHGFYLGLKCPKCFPPV